MAAHPADDLVPLVIAAAVRAAKITRETELDNCLDTSAMAIWARWMDQSFIPIPSPVSGMALDGGGKEMVEVGNNSGSEVWNNDQPVASRGDCLTHGGGRRGGEDFDFSDDFGDFGGGRFERGPRRGPGRNPFCGCPHRGRGQLPPGMEFAPPWLFDDFDEDDFDDFETMASFGGMPLGRRERGPPGSGRGGVRITREGGPIVVNNDFGGPPHRGPGRSGLDIRPDENYNAAGYDGGGCDDDDDDDDDDDHDKVVMWGGFGGRFQPRVYRTRNGGTLRIHSRC
ncbi:uncharacterized protein Z519_07402 [Cladophialophora bantiana CBS 173.52]|uniref:Uncharacterized protein n=1 Tax=Cladophialophora bantiana (strain ATCC 10958 / CBS 173.52 / CDC B-1940 / NIH 8579) TaxID=1442370 RepID=A0A0D2HGM0_CLAB1|nr:uncharacterized protein Z519_07402 [Cladophialophora bantiana CBS 173.52]KIW92418.1 hypothetical protein Z519_07402 [Cladophialophora bantiana CBS 173.52]